MSEQGPSANGTRMQSKERSVKGIMRLTAVFVVVAMAFSCLVVVNEADYSSADPDPNQCGDDILYGVSGTQLVLFGTGSTYDYSYTNPGAAPWFSNRNEFTSVLIDPRITRLGNNLFADMANLESFTVGIGDSKLTTIGTSCFFNDSNLSTVQLPSSLTTIGGSAFKGCTSLRTLTLPSGLTSMGPNIFDGSGITEVTMPSGITTVPAYCFINCASLVTVNLSASTTEIDISAFNKCTSLINVSMPDTVTSIGSNAFFRCSNLGDIHISSALTTLGSDAFYSVRFYDLNMSEIEQTVANLKGKDFYCADGKHMLISDSVVHEGSTYSMSADSSSIEVSASDVKYLSYKALSDPSVTVRFGLKDGISAEFDNKATVSLTSAGTMSVTLVDPASLDEKTRDLVGSDPVYEISFGSNTNLGGGRMTVTVPYALPEGKSADDIKAYYIVDGKISEKLDCTYADGKATFSSGHLSTYSIGIDDSSGGGKFPVWAIVLIVLVVLAAAGGAAAFFVMKNRKGGEPSEAPGPAPAEEPAPVAVPAPAEPEPEPVKEEPAEESPAEPEPVEVEPAVSEAEPEAPAQKEEPVEETPAGKAEEPVKEEPVEAPAEPEPEPVKEEPAEPVQEDVPAVPQEPVSEVKEEKPEERPERKEPERNVEDDLDPSGSNDW